MWRCVLITPALREAEAGEFQVQGQDQSKTEKAGDGPGFRPVLQNKTQTQANKQKRKGKAPQEQERPSLPCILRAVLGSQVPSLLRHSVYTAGSGSKQEMDPPTNLLPSPGF